MDDSSKIKVSEKQVMEMLDKYENDTATMKEMIILILIGKIAKKIKHQGTLP